MAYSETRSGAASVLYNLDGADLLVPKTQMRVSTESTTGRLTWTQPSSLQAPTDQLTLVGVGTFAYNGAKSTLAGVSGTLAELLTYRNGELIAQLSYGAGFDVARIGAASAAEASSLIAYEKTFLGGDDRFTASRSGSQIDQITGLAGNDWFTGLSGNDYFDGGSGLDKAIFRGNRAEYTIRQESLTDRSDATQTRKLIGYTVLDNVGLRDDFDSLLNVERLQFNDTVLALDTAATAGMAYRIYKAAFNRQPDASGLGYWIDKMDKGMGLLDVSSRFIDSNEFRSKYGSQVSNAEFLTKLYANVLQRTPDSGGYAWWLAQLTNNAEKTWQRVLADFSESVENKQNVAELIGAGILFDPVFS